jgi:CheY-like chemotaxis protein
MSANQILVVDDEVGIRECSSKSCGTKATACVLAENAQTARSARKEMRPDLVLLDIWMPDTDGITLLKEWAGSGLLTMPVVMMSGTARSIGGGSDAHRRLRLPREADQPAQAARDGRQGARRRARPAEDGTHLVNLGGAA